MSISVPKNFKCDGSSIPRFFWRLCGAPRSPSNLRAGILHDYLYANRTYDRKTCDKIFYDALVSTGKNKIIAKLMYTAVRWFGYDHF